MSRLLAYFANDPDRVACVLAGGRKELVTDGTHVDGWGIGFHQNGEVLLQRRPMRPTGDVDFYEIAGKLRSDAMIGHVRVATVGAPKIENTHPFRFRSWLFAHHGTIPAFAAVTPALRAAIPEHLRRNIRGDSDSEHIFHLFLAQLGTQRIDDPRLAPRAAVAALAATIKILEEIAPGSTKEMALAVTNGRTMLCSRRGSPVWLRRVNGIKDCPVCRETTDVGREPRRVDHEHLRGLVAVAALDAPPSAVWEELPDGHAVTADHDLKIEILPV